MNKLMLRIIVILIMSLNLCPPVDAAQKVCAKEEAYQAEGETDNLKTWDIAYGFYKRFAHCDDGAIAEGFSDAVGRLLADDWKHFERLRELCSSDKRFKNFVLKHIDMTISVDVLQKIINNTRLRCPDSAKELCKAIEATASSGWEPDTGKQ